MKDYSQNGEQRYILEYFGTDKMRGLKDPCVLSIGENDGETFSMSRALILSGWKAVLVEPSNAAFKKLIQLYEPESELGDDDDIRAITISRTDAVTLVHAAITTQDGPIDLYDSGTHLKKGDVALLSTTVPKEMDRWKKSGEVFTKTTVRGITFETLMRETGQKSFQFISIDAEGMDFEILRQIDLRAVGCRMLCIEFNQSTVAESLMRAYCAAHGLHLHYRNFENLIFVA